jgi:hypothetical protein
MSPQKYQEEHKLSWELDGYVYRISTDVQQSNRTYLTVLLSVKSDKCFNLSCVESG